MCSLIPDEHTYPLKHALLRAMQRLGRKVTLQRNYVRLQPLVCSKHPISDVLPQDGTVTDNMAQPRDHLIT